MIIGKNKLNLVIIAIITIFIISGLSLAYNHYFQYSSLERKLNKTISALSNIDSYAFTANLKLDLIIDEKSAGFLNFFDKNQGEITININGQTEKNQSQYLINLYTDLFLEDINFAIESIQIEDDLYARFDSLPSQIFPNFQKEISQFYVKFSTDEIEDNILVDNFNQKTIRDLYEIMLNNLDLNQVLVVLEEDEVIYNNNQSYYYHFSIDPDGLFRLLVNVYNDILENNQHLIKELDIDPETADQDLLEIKQEIENLEPLSFEIWIDKQSYLPHKIATKIDNYQTKINFEMVFTNFDQSVDIKFPEMIISIEEMLEKLSDMIFEQRMEYIEIEKKEDLPKKEPVIIEEKPKAAPIIIFSSDTCPFCIQLENYIDEHNLKEKLTLSIEKDISLFDEKISKCHNDDIRKAVPFLFDNRHCLLGKDDIINYLEDKINK